MSVTAVNGNQPRDHRAFPIVVVGHVDHGKSTLIGRLLHDTDCLLEGKLEQIRAVSERRGLAVEWSFALDALQIERDQGITVDTTQIWFHTARRRYVIIDAPGHNEFLKNMVSGAASAEAAILVVDATLGVSEQTRRHAYLLSLLGMRQITVAVNKMDLVGYREEAFRAVAAAVDAYLAGLGLAPSAIIPISARHGDNISAPGAFMEWYGGPTVVSALDDFEPTVAPVDRPLRLPVQDVYRLDNKRIIVGRVESGRLRVGDALRFLPGSRVARVTTIETWNAPGPTISVGAGTSVAITLDEEVFVERGSLATAPTSPASVGRLISVRVFWLSSEPLEVGRRLSFRYGTAEQEVTVEAIEHVLDVHDLRPLPADRIERNDVAQVRLRSRRPMALDVFAENPPTGRGVLVNDQQVVGGCIIDGVSAAPRSLDLTSVAASVTTAERAQANHHRGGVLWLTGLSGAGKSTLAMGLLRTLFDAGKQVHVLDGDNVRLGLNSDLGFGRTDRSENIRRTAELARMFAEAGLITIVALISPRAEDRRKAREIIGAGFHEVHIKADAATCEARDPKGLYRCARAEGIAEFPGVSMEYEPPSDPELEIETAALTPAAAVDILQTYVDSTFALGASERAITG